MDNNEICNQCTKCSSEENKSSGCFCESCLNLHKEKHGETNPIKLNDIYKKNICNLNNCNFHKK